MITPNPKTSGGARWNYLAAWGFALERALGGDLGRLVDRCRRTELDTSSGRGRGFRASSIATCPVQDTGARAATNTFVQRGIGDVLLAWENEALLALTRDGRRRVRHRHARPSAFSPSRRLRSSTPSSTAKARAALRKPISSISTRRKGRTSLRATSSAHATARSPKPTRSSFRQIRMFTIDDVFGGWARGAAEHFNDGGIYDRIFVGRGAARRGAMLARGDRQHRPGKPWQRRKGG